MKDAITGFLDYLTVERGCSPHTLVAYSQALRQLLDFLAEASPAAETWNDITRPHVQAWALHLRENGASDATVQSRVAAVKSLFRYLSWEDIIANDAIGEMDLPKVGTHLPAVMSIEEVGRFLDTITPRDFHWYLRLRDRAIFELLYATGLRASELCGLDIADVDLHDGLLRCFGKGQKERIIPVYDTAVDVLKEYVEKARPKFDLSIDPKALFLRGSNRYQDARLERRGLWWICKQYAGIASIDKQVHPHSFRHSYATHMLENGADIMTIAELLGHADIRTTQRYTHLSLDWLHEQYDKHFPRTQ